LVTAALALAGCGEQTRSAARRVVAETRPGAAHTPTTTKAPAPAPPARHTPALAHLQAAIGTALAHEGPLVGALVVDLTDRTTLYARNADVARPPASLEKLYTSVALYDLLGPAARLHTDLLGAGHLGPGGVWHGNLYLRGDGDPTFGDGTFNRVDEDGYGPTATALAAAVRADGIRRVTGRLYADPSRFDNHLGGPFTHNAPDVPDYGGQMSALVYDHGLTGRGLGPAIFAVHELALTLRAQGVAVLAAPRPARTPAGARVLAVGTSPPLTVMLRLMDVPSDDLFADLLTKQLGFHFAGTGTLAAGAAQIRADLRSRYGLTPRLFDGSGLDPADRASPAQVLALLRAVAGLPVGRTLTASLPVVGREGTVIGVGVHTAAVGRCEAKTGTLNAVSNLAGYCAARDGHELAFAVMIDGPPNWLAFTAISRIVGAIAAY
jgi:D-alanyl-D-alanine carboxypeptidase/D-alanyl-D-alanine-endopeptidase (penicillin-binding protein 4)